MKKIFNPKLFTLLQSGLSKKQLPREILAGVEVGIVALPLAIAFAVASGVSPEKGLITAIVAGFTISLLGGSRVQIGEPMFFASARTYSEVIERIGLKSQVLIIRMRHVSFIDDTGVYNLVETLKILKSEGIAVILSGVNAEVEKELKATTVKDLISNIVLCNSFEDSIKTAKELLANK